MFYHKEADGSDDHPSEELFRPFLSFQELDSMFNYVYLLENPGNHLRMTARGLSIHQISESNDLALRVFLTTQTNYVVVLSLNASFRDSNGFKSV